MGEPVFPIGAYKTAHALLSAEQLLYAVVKTLGGRVMLSEETLTNATDGDKRVFDDIVIKDGHHYIVLAVEKRLL